MDFQCLHCKTQLTRTLICTEGPKLNLCLYRIDLNPSKLSNAISMESNLLNFLTSLEIVYLMLTSQWRVNN